MSVRDFLPPVAVQALKRVLNVVRLARYRRSHVAWTVGYNIAKQNTIRAALADLSLAKLFREGGSLPANYGYGIDERCVEYPWLFSRLPAGGALFLDAGSALNFQHILQQPGLAGKTVHIMTLAPEINCYWNMGVSYIFGDLRRAPQRDGLYDFIACISTLEHVGCDNSAHTGKPNRETYDDTQMVAAMSEMWRMLKPGGRLFITVPYGLRRNYRTFQVFDSALIDQAVSACQGLSDQQRSIFRYSDKGWQWSSEKDAADSEFVNWFSLDPKTRGAMPVQRDGAAAARAVACLALTKSAAA